MPVSYTCPNPDCGVTLKTPNPVAAGKSVKCPKCGKPFVPEPADAAARPDDPAKKPAATKPPEPPPAAPKPHLDMEEEDAESIKKGYGVIKETEEEVKQAAKNRPKFTEVQDKFKKSARGPAQKLLVMPSNLLTFEGIITCVAGLVVFVFGMWPLVFNDAPPGEEEMEEAVIYMLLGLVTFGWGAAVCFGASQMQELGSYPIAMTGAIMGLVPLLVGLFGIIMLLNPKVKAGFDETVGALDEDEDEDDEGKIKSKDDDDEDEDDDEDDEEGGGSKGGKSAKKAAGKLAKKYGRRLLGRMMGGEGDDEEEEEEETAEEEEEATADEDDADDEEDEEEDEDERPKKKRRKKRADDEDF